MQDIYSTELSYEEILALDLNKLTLGEVVILSEKYKCKLRFKNNKFEIEIPFIEQARIARRELNAI